VSHFVWAWKRPPSEPEHVFNLHPDYLTKDSIGQKLVSNGYYLDPGNPDANLWIHNVATDIASHYEIDGIHWDYLRYPCEDSGYNEIAIERYNQEFGLKGQPRPDDPRFCEWRRRQLTDFLRWVNSDLLEINPSLVLSAAVFSSRDDAFRSRLSDWPTWNREGLLDICIPMDFSDDTGGVFIPRVDEALANCGIRNICIGQAGYKNKKENSLIQLKYARERGAAGIVFYSYRTPTSAINSDVETFAYLRDNFQPTWTKTPELAWKRQTGILKGTVSWGENKKPSFNAQVLLKRESFDHDLQNDFPDQTRVVVKPEISIYTEPHGKYAFFNLESGKYSVTARTKDGWSKIASVKINAGRVTIEDFVLTINQPLSGTSNAQPTHSH
jgi:hypothetical protein